MSIAKKIKEKIAFFLLEELITEMMSAIIENDSISISIEISRDDIKVNNLSVTDGPTWSIRYMEHGISSLSEAPRIWGVSKIRGYLRVISDDIKNFYNKRVNLNTHE